MADPDELNGKGSNGPLPLDQVISRAVETGYKVIEEQIQQGQRVAEQLSQGNIGPGMVNGNASEVLERVLSFYSDMGALWFEMLESIVRNPAAGQWFENFVKDSGAEKNGHAAANGRNGHAAGARHNVQVEIISSEHVGARVILDLHPGASHSALVAQELRSSDAQLPPISDVVFTDASEAWPACLQIKVPVGQPAGTYSAMVLNEMSSEPAGTLCLQIPDGNTTARSD